MFKSLGWFVVLFVLSFNALAENNWRQIAKNIVRDYGGRIESIEQLTSSSCWVVVSPSISNSEAMEIANNVGVYVKLSTGGIKGDRPTVRVFRGNKHLAVAKPSFNNLFFDVELDMQNWGTNEYMGKYRP